MDREVTPGTVSPCIGVCILDPATGLCRGCWRGIDEIAGWPAMSGSERSRIMGDIERRRAAPPTQPET